MDFGILYAINNIHNPVLDKLMVVITYLGDAGIVWIVLAVILLFMKKTRKCGVLMLISMIVGLIIGNGIIKHLVARERPCWIDQNIALLIPNPTDFSFPSGHTLASFESAVMIFLHNKKWSVFAFILAILIAFSRLYLFVHFPTDIIGGAILGTLISISTYLVSKKVEDKINKKTVKE